MNVGPEKGLTPAMIGVLLDMADGWQLEWASPFPALVTEGRSRMLVHHRTIDALRKRQLVGLSDVPGDRFLHLTEEGTKAVERIKRSIRSRQ